MKKLILLFVSALALVSCNTDDDGPRTLLVEAKIISTDLPAFFEAGESYDVKVTYLLPNACHTAAGINIQRGSVNNTDEKWRDIYITGVASYDANLTTCSTEAEEDALKKESTFKIAIPAEDEEETYTFYLWNGLDADGKNMFTEVIVPVGDPGEPDLEPAG